MLEPTLESEDSSDEEGLNEESEEEESARSRIGAKGEDKGSARRAFECALETERDLRRGPKWASYLRLQFFE